jgi:HAMP domain-containing protein
MEALGRELKAGYARTQAASQAEIEALKTEIARLTKNALRQ